MMRAVLLAAAVLVVGRPAAAEVGMRSLSFPDPVHGGTAALLVWYPTTAPGHAVRRGFLTLSVAEDAPVAEGPHPLVMVSHGSGGTVLAHAGTAMALARRGYVVAALQHRGNSFGDNGDARTERMWSARPRQFSAALDAVLADGAVGPRIDAARIGALGTSAGGYTVLVAAGGVADLGNAAAYCAAHADDKPFCGRGAPPWQGIVASPDPRLRAVVVMAPVGAMFGAGAFDGVRIPLRLYRAELDEALGAAQVEGVRDRLPGPPEYLVVPGGGHYAFVMPFPPHMAAEVGPAAQDPPGFDRIAFHERLNHEIVDFFDRTLGTAGRR